MVFEMEARSGEVDVMKSTNRQPPLVPKPQRRCYRDEGEPRFAP
ncbi:hypothetical protein FHR38_000183 [Micromonospora polyrhachis]|uniref:Uncharacterized protein n=1 Tax=Micromonospora polyrhachis TaxID=1282883 RepID=A0A7W7WM50_9ACTN|nr:hypothetical protein [Micromonospora polyrhachis]